MCWLIYFAQEMEQSSRLGLWAGFGLLAGFAGLTEPSALMVVPFLMALACWRLARDGKRWVVPGSWRLLAMAAAISPWLIRNAIVFHRFIPMRDSMGLELWMGNNGYDLRWTTDDLHPLHDAQELAAYNRMGELAYMNDKEQEAKAYIRAHPAWYVWMCVRRSIYIWTGFWSFDREYLQDGADGPGEHSLCQLPDPAYASRPAAGWREAPFDVIRYGGVLFLFPIMYYFTHPEPYHLRPLDPLLVILGCRAVFALRESLRAKAALPALPALPAVPASAEAPGMD